MRDLVTCATAALLAGTMIAPRANASFYRILHSFSGSDGQIPYASLTYADGALYGTTYPGGSAGDGTVFAVSVATGKARVLHSFLGGTDGANPSAALILVGGVLYGTTTHGGANNAGTVFAVHPNTGAESVVYTFGSGSDGAYPRGSLLKAGGTLFGTTYAGGDDQAGTVFAISLSGTVETVTYAFKRGGDGANPFAGLIAAGGSLYGTTTTAGESGGGTVFALDPLTGTARRVYAFRDGRDGADPLAGLTHIGGMLYGTAAAGGGTGCLGIGCGTVFALDPATGVERILHVFQGNDGAEPRCVLIQVGGALYGTTASGGAHGLGTVFSLDPATGTMTTVHAFVGGKDGANPYSGLIRVGGTLYGTTAYGGAWDSGTVFAFTP